MGLLVAAEAPAETELAFLSTQFQPIQEAQRMRNMILADFPREVDFDSEAAPLVLSRVAAGRRDGKHAVDLVGALHGELQSLGAKDLLQPLDDLVARLPDPRPSDRLLRLGMLGTGHQFYIPWMQTSYIMVANKAALPYLPRGADLDALTYDQLAAWAGTIRSSTGKPMLGFPAGPQGLMQRFFEGFLYPSYTGGVVVPFRSPEAEKMWTWFAGLWRSVNPNSTEYDFMQRPLDSGEVWIAFDHAARLIEVLRRHPDQFVAFPAPAGPRGRGYLPLLAGLAVPKMAADPGRGAALIDYLVRPQTQILTAGAVGFFPVSRVEWPADAEPGPRLVASAIERMRSAKDALPSLPPSGLGQRTGEFDRVFLNTFELIVVRGEAPRAVLDREAEVLRRLMAESGSPCGQPDPPSTGACPVQ